MHKLTSKLSTTIKDLRKKRLEAKRIASKLKLPNNPALSTNAIIKVRNPDWKIKTVNNIDYPFENEIKHTKIELNFIINLKALFDSLSEKTITQNNQLMNNLSHNQSTEVIDIIEHALLPLARGAKENINNATYPLETIDIQIQQDQAHLNYVSALNASLPTAIIDPETFFDKTHVNAELFLNQKPFSAIIQWEQDDIKITLNLSFSPITQ